MSILTTTSSLNTLDSWTTQSSVTVAQDPQDIMRVYGTNLATEIFSACNYETYRSYVRDLSAIGSRFTRETENNQAGRIWVQDKLVEVSNGRIEVSLVGSYDNVVGRLPGYLPGDHPVFVITSHYDTVEGSPGANDDASGVALVLELARVMSQYEWPLDIYFCAFNAAVPAEFGVPLQGSEQVAEAWSDAGIEILSLYNIDTLLYRNQYAYTDEQVLLGYAEGLQYHISEYWADLAEMMGNLYGFDVTRAVASSLFPLWTQSDHIRFYQEGYQSVVCAYESGYPYDYVSGTANDVYTHSRYNYQLGRTTAGVIGASMAFSMSRAYGEPIRHNIDGLISGGFNRTLHLAITTSTSIDATCRWWGGGAEFKVYNSAWTLVDSILFPEASAWESQDVLSTQISTPGLYYVVIDCLANYSLGYEITIQYDADENGNSILDRNEYWLDSSLFQTDSDLDMLSDAMEMIIGTDVLAPDTDLDSISDGWEYEYDLDPLDASDAQEDADNDGVSNYDEFVNSLNPHSADTDMDLMSDLFELENGLDPLVNDAELDPDEDGRSNLEEFRDGTDPQVFEQDVLDLVLVAIPSGVFIFVGVGVYLSKKYSNLMDS
ncbi:MAG: M28 family peptidase [Candidatus Thorarchaeota archaeon]